MLNANLAKAEERSWQEFVTEGDVEINRQRLPQAEISYRRALSSLEKSPHTADDTVAILEKIGSTLTLEDKTELALPVYHRALHLLEQTHGKESPKLIPALFALGSIFESEGDLSKAMKYYRKALDINERNYGPTSPAVADSLHKLGRASAKSGLNTIAEHNYKKSLSILMTNPSLTSSNELAGLLKDYNDLLQKDENSDNSLVSDFQHEFLQDRHHFPVPSAGVPPSAWAQQNKSFSQKANTFQNSEEQKILLRGFKQPLSNSTLAPAYKTMSDDLYGAHPYAQGEQYYQRMIAIDRKTLGPNHPTVADDLTGLGLLYISQARYSEAEPLFREALSIYEAVYGNDNLLVTRTRSTLADILNRLGKTKEAIALYGEAFNKGRITNEPNTELTANLLNELAFLYYSQGKLEDARTVYQWALASTKGTYGEQSILVAACLKDYANVLRSLGLTAEANNMTEKIREIEFAHSGIAGAEEPGHE